MRHWVIGDYLGGAFLGLVPSSIFMLLLGHPWYALCLAIPAAVCVIFLIFAIVVIALTEDDVDGFDYYISEPDRKFWRK